MEQVYIAYEYRSSNVWYKGGELCPKDKVDERINELIRIVTDDHKKMYRNFRIAPKEEFWR